MFYDAEGSRLFEQICDLPEYYLTRTEDALLADHAAAMVGKRWRKPPAIIELGSGSSTKTRRLISAALELHGSLTYAPIDVSSSILEDSARDLARDFPEIRIIAFAADYRAALERASAALRGPKLVLFLGSSLGNYETDEAVELLAMVRRNLGPSDRLLLGVDLDKDPAELVAAYDDTAGVTAAFNRNVLVRINRELDGDFDLDSFRHEARYVPEHRRIEMHLVSQRRQTVTIPGAGIAVEFEAGESIHTENSHKYTLSKLRELALRAGFREERAWTDPASRYRLQRWCPVPGVAV
jgi:dimethylhistidine N-methyltransferase